MLIKLDLDMLGCNNTGHNHLVHNRLATVETMGTKP